ncbi:MAG: hypothetical protein LQ350_002626 [Teloschistes chrysophthalmus]|nr:MAG: hypothetical protein LQ350_002626 [Niorma chrysophthalma]
MKSPYLVIVSIAVTTTVHAQSLLEATAPYPQLSDFNDLLSAFPDVATNLLTNVTSILNRQTVLVPSNDAFANYRRQMGSNISSLPSSDIGDILNYHTLQGALSSPDIQQPGGLISSTALADPQYANREVLSNGGQPSQVVYLSSSDTSAGVKIKVRQVNALNSFTVGSGAGSEIELEQTPGNWSGGFFYVVNGFLTLPMNQTITMTARNLTSFVVGLNRTNVTEGTNAAKGLTCVCPNNEAFASMGDLANSNGSYYTTNFTDGDLIQSQNGYPILVTRKNGSIFLNDAQLVGTNFIANTGCVHALDRIMGFLNTTTNITTPANASIYSDVANIPSPTPLSTASTESGGAIPTTNATGDMLLPPSTASTTAASSTGPAAGPQTGSVTGAGAPEPSATGTSDAPALLSQHPGPLISFSLILATAVILTVI